MEGKTVLIIDDDSELCEYLLAALSEFDCKTYIAYDGETGFSLFQKKQIDLVITDIYMPKMNGLELIQKMRELKPEIRILAISGGHKIFHQNALEWAQAGGAFDILEKPFDHTDFMNKVKGILDPKTSG